VATVVDALVVTLGLDAKDFTKGVEATEVALDDVATAATKTVKVIVQGQLNASLAIKNTVDVTASAATQMQAQGTKASEFFSRIKIEALGLIGVLAGSGALGVFVKDASGSLAELGRSAVNLGVGVQALSAFEMAIERNGGSADAAKNSLSGLVNKIEDFKIHGGDLFGGYLNPIGANIDDNPLVIIEKFQKFIEQHRNDPALIQNIGAGLGLDKGLTNALIQIGTLTKYQQELGRSYEIGVPTQEMIDRMTALQKATIGLGQAALFSGELLLNKMAGGLTAVADRLTTLIAKYPALANAITASIIALAGVKPALWILRALGLSAIGGEALGIGALYEATSIPDLTPNEAAEINKLRAERGLPPIGPQGTPTSLPPGYVEGSGVSGPPSRGSANYTAYAETRTFWLAKGFTEEQVAGILAGGPGAESSFNPTLTGDNGTSYGLYQEHETRRDALFAKYGSNPTVAQQNQFAYDEAVAMGLIPDLHNAKTGEDAAQLWTVRFENPEDAFSKANDRAAAVPKYRAPIVPSGSGAPVPVVPGPRVSSSSSNATTVHVGTVNVHTQATDAAGIARDAQQAITDSWMVMANRGLQ
jgi:hypothetical protein